jgi:hypothetical protein
MPETRRDTVEPPATLMQPAASGKAQVACGYPECILAHKGATQHRFEFKKHFGGNVWPLSCKLGKKQT